MAGLAVGCSTTSELTISLPPLDGVESEIVDAIGAAEQRVREDPSSPASWAALADRLSAHGFKREAAAAYREAERLAPDEFLWPYLEGLAQSGIDYGATAAALERALAIDASYAPAHLHYGRALRHLDRRDEARTAFESAARLDPRRAEAELGLGRLALAEDRPADARVHLERAVALDPNRRDVQEALARALFALGDEGAAQRHAALSLRMPQVELRADPRSQRQLEPAGSRQRDHFARLLMRAGDLPAAEQQLRRAIEINPRLHTARYRLAWVLSRTDRPDESLEQIDRAIALKGDVSEYRTFRGRALVRLGRPTEAVDTYREALATAPDSARAHRELGGVLVELGDTDDGLEHLRRAVELSPRDAPSRRDLGLALLELGRAADALPELEEALRLMPDDVTIQSAVRDCRQRLQRD